MALDGTTAILETQLLPKEDLYKRWIGATDEEIADHFDKGELRAYARHKGPINRIIWCKPGHVYYQSNVSYSDPNLYEYNDYYCDYFLLEDVVRCETEHPEYTGNVTPESLGLAQVGTPESVKASLPHADLVTLSADEVVNYLKITPIELVDILNGYNVSIDVDNLHIETKRLVTVDEEAFREHANSGWNERFFNVKGLENVKIYQLDFDRYCETWGIQKHDQAGVEGSSGLESQLAEAQKLIESLRQWNKRLNEQNQALRAELAAAQETQPAAAEPATTVDAAKWENSVKAVLEIWAEIVQGDKTDWKEVECRAELAKRYSDYHTKVLSLAWSLLPGAFKHGRGRPKKNPEKSQQSDNP